MRCRLKLHGIRHSVSIVEEQLELHAGMFDLGTPVMRKGGIWETLGSGLLRVLYFICIGLMLICFIGAISLFDSIGTEDWWFFAAISVAGLLSGAVVVGAAGSEISLQMQKIREKNPPRDCLIRAEKGGVELQNFWNSATVHIPSVDDRGWVFEAPGETHWYRENPYMRDEEGVLKEHPTKIGTPVPATISMAGIASIVMATLLIFSCYAVAVYTTAGWECDNGEIVRLAFAGGEDDDGRPIGVCGDRSDYGISMPAWAESPEMENQFSAHPLVTYGTILISLIWMGAAIIRWKRVKTIQDQTTSLVRSVAIGNAELVGQVRKHLKDPMTVEVDDDPSKTVDDLYHWQWTYEIYVCRRVQTKDGTEERCAWEQVRQKHGSRDFILHDGTGGIVVRPRTWKWKRTELGQHLVRWECAHDLRIRGLLTNLFTSGDVRRHRWTLYGLKIGDPIYVTGEVQPREEEELRDEGIKPYKDRARKSGAVEVIGNDAPGFRSYLERGSELGAMSNARSDIDYFFPAGIVVIGAMMLFSVWGFA